MDTNKDISRAEKMVRFPDQKDDFIPETEFGRELWVLRQKAIAEGMTLLTGEEISDEISTGRERSWP